MGWFGKYGKKFCPLVDKCDEKVEKSWYSDYCAGEWSTCPFYRNKFAKLPKEWKKAKKLTRG